ncbi:hypothetical protein ABI59_09445 [Acidobacteria bacterium Mor1]|nr:hypothetical protein ABI59_09445 [Acidobacteria bacterium Mor1]
MAIHHATKNRHPLDNLWTDFCSWVDSTEGQIREERADRLETARRRVRALEARDERHEPELQAAG